MYGTVDSVVERMRGGERATSCASFRAPHCRPGLTVFRQPVNFVDFHLSSDSRLARQVSPPKFMHRVCVNHRYGSRLQRQAQRSIPGIDVGLVISEEGSRTKAHEDYGTRSCLVLRPCGAQDVRLDLDCRRESDGGGADEWGHAVSRIQHNLRLTGSILPPRLRHSVVTHEDTIAFSQNFLLLERWQDILAANAVLIGTRNEQNIFHRVME